MNELIPICEKNGKKAVNARDLHAFLGSKRDFSNWIKDRIYKYEFIENLEKDVYNSKNDIKIIREAIEAELRRRRVNY
ncbi:antA/AntB antirepressor family protein [Xylanibacter muris]|uniref:AntA/AntB antirepressor domain-containing protein n=1 Tax=Xylanibacter muris TaxID=2736290 RepID=A0ABX2AMU1_9BACT|nr:antA/AntB antirepressor family protein [Xylanibacter muris]NPD92334.1 hypothetical protein [Xylanibacter muris]